jgi:hypothetical protein
MRCASFVVLFLPLLAPSITGASPSPTPAADTSVDKIAEAYVKLVLAMGHHDPELRRRLLRPAGMEGTVGAQEAA